MALGIGTSSDGMLRQSYRLERSVSDGWRQGRVWTRHWCVESARPTNSNVLQIMNFRRWVEGHRRILSRLSGANPVDQPAHRKHAKDLSRAMTIYLESRARRGLVAADNALCRAHPRSNRCSSRGTSRPLFPAAPWSIRCCRSLVHGCERSEIGRKNGLRRNHRPSRTRFPIPEARAFKAELPGRTSRFGGQSVVCKSATEEALMPKVSIIIPACQSGQISPV